MSNKRYSKNKWKSSVAVEGEPSTFFFSLQIVSNIETNTLLKTNSLGAIWLSMLIRHMMLTVLLIKNTQLIIKGDILATFGLGNLFFLRNSEECGHI